VRAMPQHRTKWTTWLEFKLAMEEQGVKNLDEIDWIDVAGPGYGLRVRRTDEGIEVENGGDT